jgi:hypothetical protein
VRPPSAWRWDANYFRGEASFLKSLNDFGQKIDEIKRTGVFKELKIHCINGF